MTATAMLTALAARASVAGQRRSQHCSRAQQVAVQGQGRNRRYSRAQQVAVQGQGHRRRCSRAQQALQGFGWGVSRCREQPAGNGTRTARNVV